jgi:hypothetical protein
MYWTTFVNLKASAFLCSVWLMMTKHINNNRSHHETNNEWLKFENMHGIYYNRYTGINTKIADRRGFSLFIMSDDRAIIVD